METKSEVMHVRVPPSMKRQAEAIFSKIGLSATEATRLFYSQVILQEGLPFKVRIPNKKTQKRLRETMEGKGLIKTTLEDLKNAFDVACTDLQEPVQKRSPPDAEAGKRFTKNHGRD